MSFDLDRGLFLLAYAMTYQPNMQVALYQQSVPPRSHQLDHLEGFQQICNLN